METVSKKRGRPRRFSDKQVSFIASLFPGVKTKRGRQNLMYRQIGIEVLVNDPQFTWLADGPAMKRGEPDSWKPGLLVELGRIDDADQIREIAAELCRLKPSIQDAKAMIRRYRGARSSPACPMRLMSLILRVVDDYRMAHPDITLPQIEIALEQSLEAVRDHFAEECNAPEPA